MLKLKSIQFSYESGEETFSAVTTCSVSTADAALNVRIDGDRFSASVHADREIVIRQLRAVFEYDFHASERIFLNGYQSWTDSFEHSIHDRMRGLNGTPAAVVRKYGLDQYGDYQFLHYPNTPGRLHGWSYGYLRTGPTYRLIGSLSEDCGFTIIRTDVRRAEIIIDKDCTDLHLTGDYDGLQLLLTEGSENAVFDAYFQALGTTLRPEAKPIFGYTSWYRHYQNISETILRTDLEGLLSQPYKPDVFQLDDGYQTAIGDWLSIDKTKFPDGLSGITSAIKENGILPGIWLAPFVCETKSALFREHKDWLVYDASGDPVRGGSNWSGFYVLDLYNEDFREYLREVFRTITQDWGFKLLKLDFLYATCIQPRYDKTRGQIMADGMRFLREIAGDAFILGCGVPLASAFGRVDYCRIGCDVSLDWNDKLHMRLTHRERVSTRNTILDSVFRRQLNGRAFLNDPDVFLLRNAQNALTAAQKTCLAEINALCGSVLFTSDNAADYNDDQLRVLRRIMRLREEAKIISAEISSGLLKVHVNYRGKLIVRIYPL